MTPRCDRAAASGRRPWHFSGSEPCRTHRPTHSDGGRRGVTARIDPACRGAPCPWPPSPLHDRFPDRRFRSESAGRTEPLWERSSSRPLGAFGAVVPGGDRLHRSRVGPSGRIRRRSSEELAGVLPEGGGRPGAEMAAGVAAAALLPPPPAAPPPPPPPTATGATAAADGRRGELAGSRAHRSAPRSTAGRGGGRRSQLDVAAAGRDSRGRRPDVERHDPDEGDEDDRGTREDAPGRADADDEAL